MKQCEYNSVTDNADLMIADYIDASISPEHPVEPDIPSQMLRCEIDGNDVVRCGRSRTYKPVFYGKDGSVDNMIDPVWTLDGGVGIVNTVVRDRNLVVEAVDDDHADGSSFMILLNDADGKYQPVAKKVEVAALL